MTCETKELFAARPQAVAVDINDLGTVKLNLEIAWYPFDVEDVTASSSAGNKTAALQRRMSMYSQGTPETPTFKDHSFFVSPGWLVQWCDCGVPSLCHADEKAFGGDLKDRCAGIGTLVL